MANKQGPTSVSIARHAVQAMLHHALETRPGPCCGLLAGKCDDILMTAPFACKGGDPTGNDGLRVGDLEHTLQEWKQRGMALVGVYRSFSEHEEIGPGAFTAVQDMLQEKSSAHGNAPGQWLHLAVLLDTEGRLEIDAYQARDGQWTEVPLLLYEDGEAIPQVC